MSYKRSRTTFEADLGAQQQSPYITCGTPLPPLDAEVRDDGSFVPVWKQEVRDEQGRKRFHGAFTGGFSAGYFNTVGSKDGWTPSTFTSSRTNRRKDDAKAGPQRPEDYMDAEDLADAEEAKQIQTSRAFAGLGSTSDDAVRKAGLLGLFRAGGGTMGTKLLKKMGWKEGQGIGPKIRRGARLDMNTGDSGPKETYHFAPDDVPMIRFERKTDRKGLGYEGQSRLTAMGPRSTLERSAASEDDEDEDEDSGVLGRPRISLTSAAKKKGVKSSIGVGVLNDTGSDDEDPYEIGPRISYNRVIVAQRKKKKKETKHTTLANPAVKVKPAFMPSKKSALAKIGLGIRKCHDGRLPLDGFVFGREADALTSASSRDNTYPPPEIPPGWKSAKIQEAEKLSINKPGFVSTAEAAKASTLDPRSRASLLGEKQLPGKSVFDFMSESARAHLAAATGKTDLPPAKNEIPAGFARSQEERMQEERDLIPTLDKATAVAALARGAGGGGPYGDDEGKCSRYRAYLELQAGLRSALPPKPASMKMDDWARELLEFFNCARIFKPMTGFMASRFTTSSSTSQLSTGSRGVLDGADLLTKPMPKPQDPAEEAAKLGMYGPITRSVIDFFPARLLCKRFGVKPPVHVQPDLDGKPPPAPQRPVAPAFLIDKVSVAGDEETLKPEQALQEVVVDWTRNEALEGKRAGEDVFKAIFGDSDDES